MNNSILTIMKKEMARFFGDRKIAFSTILLPGLMIYIMYSLMGSALSGQITVEEDFVAACYAVNLPEDETVRMLLDESFNMKEIASREELENAKKKVSEGEVALCAVFPEHFVEEAKRERKVTDSSLPPEVQIFYNSLEAESNEAYTEMCTLLDEYEGMLANRFNINSGDGVNYDLAKEESAVGSLFSSMLPMLLLIFLFSATLSVAPESIAGEKERGTVATLLVTPVKRGHIAVGKIMALSVISLLSGASSTVGTVLALPKLMGEEGESLNGSVYGVVDYLLLAVVILSTVLVFVTVMSLISAYAKSIKEAQTFATPLMVILVFVGITAMFGNGPSTELYRYAIPVYNSVQAMVGIFQFAAAPGMILLTAASNLFVTLLGVFVLSKMFESERIIFN